MPLLKENLPTKYNRYVEPFCGSASLFFEQNNRKGLLSDINADLINAFNQIKIDRSIRNLVIKIPNTKEKYYEVRAKNPADLNDLERAVRFLYLNRYCFNGVYRTNRKGEFNVPRGTRTGDFPSQLVFD
ncbi:MAG: Dam family site-specific DNA-(adenine-N6)-methyltransferase, partial [Thiotrichales bacterium]|nr:Dam family site-specific DNA-(adenine-N6)-methyltransferase [Thiotrichales bacterium]